MRFLFGILILVLFTLVSTSCAKKDHSHKKVDDTQTNYIEELEDRIDELEDSLLFFIEGVSNYQEVTDLDLQNLRLEFTNLMNTVIDNQNKINELENLLAAQGVKLSNIEKEILKIQILEVMLDEFQIFVNTNFINDVMLEDKFLEVVDMVNSFSDSFLAQNNELLDKIKGVEVLINELGFYSRDNITELLKDLRDFIIIKFRKKRGIL